MHKDIKELLYMLHQQMYMDTLQFSSDNFPSVSAKTSAIPVAQQLQSQVFMPVLIFTDQVYEDTCFVFLGNYSVILLVNLDVQ